VTPMAEHATTIYIRAESDVITALVTAGDFAVKAGFGERGKHGIMTVVAELARNVVKYATSGRVTLTELTSPNRRGLEIEVVDQGPGIVDLAQAMRDHFSTGKTLGLGLPGAKRLMDDFSITSTPGRGTRIVARKWL
jgi:serine/threonine-protein kinase RsbT